MKRAATGDRPYMIMMNILFYTTAGVALIAALLSITRRNAMHGILYLIVLLLASAILFFMLGAPFLAALQIIVYAGAIIILFIFVIMMINPDIKTSERRTNSAIMPWFGPLVLVIILGIEWIYLLKNHTGVDIFVSVGPERIGKTLFQDYFIGVQLVGLFLLVGLIGAYHLGRKK